MPTHNPLCLHGGAHAPSECRDRWNQPLKTVADPEPVVEEVAEAGDEALKLLLSVAGNVLKAEAPAAPAQ